MELFKGKQNMPNLLKNRKMLLALGAVGVVLMFNPFAWFQGSNALSQPATQTTTDAAATSATGTTDPYEAVIEKQMTGILDSISGVSNAKVMINFDSTATTVYAANITSNTTTTQEGVNGGSRTITTVNKQGNIVMESKNGENEPVVEKVIRPKVRGVVVVAEGAESIKVQALIMDAIQRALDVPYYKISIQPEKQQ